MASEKYPKNPKETKKRRVEATEQKKKGQKIEGKSTKIVREQRTEDIYCSEIKKTKPKKKKKSKPSSDEQGQLL